MFMKVSDLVLRQVLLTPRPRSGSRAACTTPLMPIRRALASMAGRTRPHTGKVTRRRRRTNSPEWRPACTPCQLAIGSDVTPPVAVAPRGHPELGAPGRRTLGRQLVAFQLPADWSCHRFVRVGLSVSLLPTATRGRRSACGTAAVWMRTGPVGPVRFTAGRDRPGHAEHGRRGYEQCAKKWKHGVGPSVGNGGFAMAHVSQPEFGQRLRELRLDRGIKQTELAGGPVSASYISRLEMGNRLPSPNALSYLAATLGVTVDELTTQHDPEGRGGAAEPDRATTSNPTRSTLLARRRPRCAAGHPRTPSSCSSPRSPPPTWSRSAGAGTCSERWRRPTARPRNSRPGSTSCA